MYVQICGIREGQSIEKKNTGKEKYVMYVDDSAHFFYTCVQEVV
jgi:hypothetical protein